MDLTLGREATPVRSQHRCADQPIAQSPERRRREPRIIKTIRNEGYILAAQVERVE
jgi:hypothetical protein